MTAGRFCVRNVDLVDADETAQVAAGRMHSRKVGTLVVLGEDKKPVGIVTDRDLCVRVVGEARDPATTDVKSVMTPAPKTVQEETPLEDALSVMRSGPFRRLLVVDDKGQLVGLLSLDDILDLLVEEFGLIGKLIKGESPESLAEEG